MWNIKYLPRYLFISFVSSIDHKKFFFFIAIFLIANIRFKWIHLSERLAYERAVHKQRLRTEIAQAKREANFFSYNVDRSKKLKRKQASGETSDFQIQNIKQRDTDIEIRNKKKNKKEDQTPEDRTEFLRSLFS